MALKQLRHLPQYGVVPSLREAPQQGQPRPIRPQMAQEFAFIDAARHGRLAHPCGHKGANDGPQLPHAHPVQRLHDLLQVRLSFTCVPDGHHGMARSVCPLGKQARQNAIAGNEADAGHQQASAARTVSCRSDAETVSAGPCSRS